MPICKGKWGNELTLTQWQGLATSISDCGIACCIFRISVVKVSTQWGFKTGPSLSNVMRTDI